MGHVRRAPNLVVFEKRPAGQMSMSLRTKESEVSPQAKMTNDDRALLRFGEALRASGYGFTTVTPATHARVNARPENKEAKDLRDVFGWSRPFSRDVLPADIVALMQE